MNSRLVLARRCAATLAASLSLAACAGAPAPPADATAQVTGLIGSAACSRDDDCATIGTGALACGGPQAYLAWSKTQTDAQALAAAVARQRQEREKQIARSGEQSMCMVIPDPGARCNAAQRCELNKPGSGGGGATTR